MKLPCFSRTNIPFSILLWSGWSHVVNSWPLQGSTRRFPPPTIKFLDSINATTPPDENGTTLDAQPPVGLIVPDEIAPASTPTVSSPLGFEPDVTTPQAPADIVPAPAPIVASPQATDPLFNCLEVPKSICLSGTYGGNYVLQATATPRGMVFWYRFDKSLPVDDSGNRHHLLDEEGLLTPVAAGPGVLGRGASAHFDGLQGRVVRAVDAFATGSFTVSLWIYLLQREVGAWRTIFSRGTEAKMLPALLLWPDQSRLRAIVRAGETSATLDGIGVLPVRRWTHVALSCSGGVLRLLVNGVKEGEVILSEGFPTDLENVGDLYIGRDQWRAGTRAFIDDFRWYSRPLFTSEIKALVPPSLVGTGADFVRFGCLKCSYPEAVRSCSASTHLCDAQEILSGGLQFARSMGWLAASPEVWFEGDTTADQEKFTLLKLGLCCTD